MSEKKEALDCLRTLPQWIRDSTIYVTRHGSHAYGTSTPESDLDLRGIAIPPSEYFLGFHNRFEQAESKDPDLVIYDIRKFFHLAAACNPNVIELLWTDPEDHLLVTPAAEKLISHRKLFLSRRAKHTFSGYAIAQLKRIKTHRKWLLDPPVAPPTREEYGLPERTVIPKDQLLAAQAAIQRKLDTWEWKHLEDAERATVLAVIGSVSEVMAEMGMAMKQDDRVMAAGRSLGFESNFLEVLDRERRYGTAQRHWESYQTWKRTRNPARAALEAKFSFDAKHASHLVRLLRECKEILETGEVLVRRPDAEELLAIKNGAWSYEKIVTWAEEQDRELNEVMKSSPLPWGPPVQELDALCCELVKERIDA